jgi:hypothetical protein
MLTTLTFLYILLGGATLIALLTTVDLFLPKPVTRARQKLETSSTKSFLVGLINILFWFVVLVIWFVWTQYNGGPDIMAYVIGTALALLLLIGVIVPGIPGLAALAQLTGARFNRSASPLGQDLRGGLLLVLACLTPYIGWFVFTPALLSTAIGAGLLTFFQHSPKPTVLDEKPA